VDDNPFSEVPQSDHEILRQLWYRTKSIEQQTMMTNGRVSRLERFQWAVAGGLVVVGSIVVPLFVRIVMEQQ
jgi:hypothetical protein